VSGTTGGASGKDAGLHPSLRGLGRRPRTLNWFLDKCVMCGTEFEFRQRYDRPLRRNRPRTCSPRCWTEYRRTRQGGERTAECIVCHAAFTPEHSQSKTCSAECRDANRVAYRRKLEGRRREARLHGCGVCGAPVGRTNRVYCSEACVASARGRDGR